MPKLDMELSAHIDKLIEVIYNPRPAWADEQGEGYLAIRNRNILSEYARLQGSFMLCPEGAQLVLARLINRSPCTIENILWPGKKTKERVR
jgi:hypothetical protein